MSNNSDRLKEFSTSPGSSPEEKAVKHLVLLSYGVSIIMKISLALFVFNLAVLAGIIYLIWK